jgi:septal ring factor EnvC (AmiA/AmiB activator)
MNHEIETYEGEIKELRQENGELRDRIKDLETTVAYVEKELQESQYRQKSVDY